jgi:hypothetical protein
VKNFTSSYVQFFQSLLSPVGFQASYQVGYQVHIQADIKEGFQVPVGCNMHSFQ